jgi:hypothetical protein
MEQRCLVRCRRVSGRDCAVICAGHYYYYYYYYYIGLFSTCIDARPAIRIL